MTANAATGKGKRAPKAAKSEHDPAQSKRAEFLSVVADTGIILRACELTGIGRTNVYRWRKEPEFEAALQLAVEEATERLELEARRRAFEGVEKPVYQGGEHVGDIQEYSDTLLMFLLKAARPEVYRETIRVDIRREAERMAEALGMDAADVMAAVEEAERILRDAGTAEASR